MDIDMLKNIFTNLPDKATIRGDVERLMNGDEYFCRPKLCLNQVQLRIFVLHQAVSDANSAILAHMS